MQLKNVLFLIAFSFPFLANAQLFLRPQAGFNSSQLTKDIRDGEFSDQLGFQFGIDFQLGGRLYIQPGIFWQSSKNEIKERINGNQSDFVISRIQVPVQLGYRLIADPDGLLNARIFTGPSASFIVNKNLNEVALFDKDDFKGALYGWNVGFGIDLAIFFVDAGYSVGLNEVFESSLSSAKNNIFFVNVGLRLGG